jgi:hypothetical protein
VLTRRECLKLPLLGLLGTLRLPLWAETPLGETENPPKRRALVIGINNYQPKPAETKESEPDQTKEAHASASAVAKKTRQFGNLDGAINDAVLFSQLLKDRFGFLPEDIVFLKDEQATREAILREFRQHLITAAAPGDISLFYYAGHGSQVRNLGSDEADQMDETLVPADSRMGVPDIRDKEMARLYRAALQKGVSLTIILDSCHSGGMTRGLWNGIGKTRELPPDPHVVNDPPDRDPVTGKKLPDATTMGMLFLAAARKDQPAGEVSVLERDNKGVEQEIPHGAFTVALAKVLATPAADQSVEQICIRVQALLASEGRVQLPICGGANRESRSLLGHPAGIGTSITLASTGVTDKGLVRLQGGTALGLAPGCTLVRTNGSAIRLQLAKVELASSEANLLDGAAASDVHAGDLFKLQTWVVPPDTAIKLYFPKDGPTSAALHEFAQALLLASRQMNFEILPDVSSASPPTHVLYWKDGSYRLELFPAVAAAIQLGPSPGVEDLTKALAGSKKTRLWTILPPDRNLVSQIRLGAGTQNPAVQIVERPKDCVYHLAGRPAEDSIEYSWVFKDAAIVDPNEVHLPLRTDWKTTGTQLTDLAVRLARIYAWLNFGGPAGGDESFPYRLAFLKTGAKESVVHGPFRFGEKYKIVFEASPEDLKRASEARGVSKRYVYVFLIDSSGEAQCLFPDPSNGNDNNRLPRSDPPSPRIEATGSEYDLEISEPAGTDNYFMVASEQPLDPGVFQWSGVRKAAATRGVENPLEILFSSVGEGTRGVQKTPSVPVSWSIESMAIRSMP